MFAVAEDQICFVYGNDTRKKMMCPESMAGQKAGRVRETGLNPVEDFLW